MNEPEQNKHIYFSDPDLFPAIFPLDNQYRRMRKPAYRTDDEVTGRE
jgi:hypothetical protein